MKDLYIALLIFQAFIFKKTGARSGVLSLYTQLSFYAPFVLDLTPHCQIKTFLNLRPLADCLLLPYSPGSDGNIILDLRLFFYLNLIFRKASRA